MASYRMFLILFLSLGVKSLYAQVISLGVKQDEKTMFQASVNAPLIFDNRKPYDVTVGMDYTTRNAKAPSGLQPQVTGLYYFIDSKYKSYLLAAGVTTGYLFDFNQQFNNQFRVSPHLYMELWFANIKVGYDYMAPLDKGYPFVSIGIGGGMLFRHFSIM